jgi:hypothetical protein
LRFSGKASICYLALYPIHRNVGQRYFGSSKGGMNKDVALDDAGMATLQTAISFYRPKGFHLPTKKEFVIRCAGGPHKNAFTHGKLDPTQ